MLMDGARSGIFHRTSNLKGTLSLPTTTHRVAANGRALSDLALIASGAMAPLTGFMGFRDYESVLDGCVLQDGTPLGLPVTLSVSAEEAARLRDGEAIEVTDVAGTLRGRMVVEEKYTRNRREEALQVFGTDDVAHPGVRTLMETEHDVCLAGPVEPVGSPLRSAVAHLPSTPAEVRAAIQKRGWKTVVGFQTRNPVHRAHEYILRCALEMVDGLLLHPLVGDTRAEDVPVEVRMECYEVLLRHYLSGDRALLGVFPAAMRYGGPREALYHATLRKNYGCTHFIVGRDHAGVGSYYGPYDAQRIFDRFSPAQLGIVPLKFDATFYCTACGSHASSKTCGHAEDRRLSLSGTLVREMLRNGQPLPVEFTRPEVAAVLGRYYQSNRAQEAPAPS